MIDQKNLLLISYPSGGFGNFIFHVLTEFSDNTYKPNNDKFKLSSIGDSHNTNKYTTTWYHDPDHYKLNYIDTDKKILILCDNGINNDTYTKIYSCFNDIQIIRNYISKPIRPVIYKTCVYKAQRSTELIENYNHISANWIDKDEYYAQRENFTLLYHNWPFKWDEVHENSIINLNLESLIINPYHTIEDCIKKIGGNVINEHGLKILCNNWQSVNYEYFKIYYQWDLIKKCLTSDYDLDISEITNLHDQGYINYCIEEQFNVTIPVYDYKNWFTNTKQIKEMLECLK